MLTAEKVTQLIKRLLYKQEEVPDNKAPPNAIIVTGLVQRFGFHPERAKAAKPEIDDLLNELPEEFHKDKGGGWSFLNLCHDKNGKLWGEHRDMEALICLGIAVGSAEWQLREHMNQLPGGVPYVQIHT